MRLRAGGGMACGGGTVGGKHARTLAWDDRVFPAWAWPAKALLRGLSSVWLGLFLMVGIAFYAAAGALPIGWLVGSETPPEARVWMLPAFDMAAGAYFGAWPMRAMLLGLVINMIVATARRIEVTAANSGVLMVHGGVVLMALGGLLDASSRREGVVVLPEGDAVSHMWDTGDLELEIERGGAVQRATIAALPRWNDYGTPWSESGIDLRLDEFGASIIGYAAYADVREALAPVSSSETGAGIAPAWEYTFITAGAQERPGSMRGFAMLSHHAAPQRVAADIRVEGIDPEHGDPLDVFFWDAMALPGSLPGAPLLIVQDPAGVIESASVVEGVVITTAGGLRLSIVKLDPASIPPEQVLELGRSAGCIIPADPRDAACVIEIAEPDGARSVRVVHAGLRVLDYSINLTESGQPRYELARGSELRLGFFDGASWAVMLGRGAARVRSPSGPVRFVDALRPGMPIDVGEGRRIVLDRFHDRARLVAEPVEVPPALRKPELAGTHRHAAVRIALDDAREPAWVSVGAGAEREAGHIEMRDGSRARIKVSPSKLELSGWRLTLLSAGAGPMGPRALIRAEHPGTGRHVEREVAFNVPMKLKTDRGAGLTLAIAAWDDSSFQQGEGSGGGGGAEAPSFIALTAVETRGKEFIIAAALFFALGMPWVMFVKPRLDLRARAAGEAL